MSAAAVLITVLAAQLGFYTLLWATAAWLRLARRVSLHWALAAGLLALSALLIVERASLNPWLGGWLANLLNIAGFVLIRRGVQVFMRRQPTDAEHALVTLLGAAGVAASLAGWWPEAMRSVSSSAAMAWTLWRLGLEAMRGLRAEFGGVAARACAAPYMLVGALIGLRPVVAWLTGPGTAPAAAPPLQVASSFNVGMLAAFVGVSLLMVSAMAALIVMRLIVRLRRLSERDPLTGVLNRRGIAHAMARERAMADRSGRGFALLVVDADHFKRINDRHGHETGDAVLVGLARTLREASREGDHVGRLGGEEFCLLLHEADEAEAVLVASRLLEDVRRARFEPDAPGVRLTVSIGVTACRGRDDSAEGMWRRADAALYAAKSAGRDRMHLASVKAGRPHGGWTPPRAAGAASR